MPVTWITPTLDRVEVPSVLRRIERTSLDHGVAYPWWMPVTCKAGQLVATIVAFEQRDRLGSWQFAAVLALLAGPLLIEVRTGRWLPVWVRAVPYLLAYALLELTPLTNSSKLDAAVIVLALIVADFGARDGWRGGLFALGVSVLPLLAWTPQPDLMISLLFLALGSESGYMVHWSARALAAERHARAEAYERATLAERDRIAREIHDLVAHSLSVTMLHVTAARRMVADGDDPGEVVSALADAEAVGRRAMDDIRQTVSGLASSRHPLPSADDLPRLVADLQAAGQPVESTLTGDLSTLPAPIGLGLYRVTQESLANVVKHAPGVTAELAIDVTARQARVTVRNRLGRGPAGHGDGLGSGIAGMRARIEQLGGRLTAGRADGAWVVEAVVPLKAADRRTDRVLAQ